MNNDSDDLTPLTALGLRCKTAEEFARKTPTLPLGFQTHLLPLLSPELPAPLKIIIHASILRAWPWKTTEHVCPLVSRMNLTETHRIPSVTEYGLDSTAAASIWLTFTQKSRIPICKTFTVDLFSARHQTDHKFVFIIPLKMEIVGERGRRMKKKERGRQNGWGKDVSTGCPLSQAERLWLNILRGTWRRNRAHPGDTELLSLISALRRFRRAVSRPAYLHFSDDNLWNVLAFKTRLDSAPTQRVFQALSFSRCSWSYQKGPKPASSFPIFSPSLLSSVFLPPIMVQTLNHGRRVCLLPLSPFSFLSLSPVLTLSLSLSLPDSQLLPIPFLFFFARSLPLFCDHGAVAG